MAGGTESQDPDSYSRQRGNGRKSLFAGIAAALATCVLLLFIRFDLIGDSEPEEQRGIIYAILVGLQTFVFGYAFVIVAMFVGYWLAGVVTKSQEVARIASMIVGITVALTLSCLFVLFPPVTAGVLGIAIGSLAVGWAVFAYVARDSD